MHHDSNKTQVTLDMPSGIRNFAEYQLIAQQQTAAQLKCHPHDIVLEYPRRVRASSTLVVTVRPAGTVVTAEVKRLSDWRRLCAIGGVVMAAAVLVAGWQWQYMASQQRHIDAQRAMAMSQLQTLKGATQASTDQPIKRSPMEQAKRVVLQDMNPFFVAIEGVRVPQVRLRQLTIDTASQHMHVTYELREITQAAQVTAALAASGAALEWTLVGVSDRQAQWTGASY
jgi:hypothetical protein